jgi:hypothetical protein
MSIYFYLFAFLPCKCSGPSRVRATPSSSWWMLTTTTLELWFLFCFSCFTLTESPCRRVYALAGNKVGNVYDPRNYAATPMNPQGATPASYAILSHELRLIILCYPLLAPRVLSSILRTDHSAGAVGHNTRLSILSPSDLNWQSSQHVPSGPIESIDIRRSPPHEAGYPHL